MSEYQTSTNPGYADQEKRRADEIQRMLDYSRNMRRAEQQQQQAASPEPTPAPVPTPSPAPQQAPSGQNPVGSGLSAAGIYSLAKGATGASTAAPVATSTASSTVATPEVISAARVPAAATGTTAAGTTGTTLGAVGNTALGAAGAVGLYDTYNRWHDKPRTAKNISGSTAEGAASGAALGSSIDAATGGTTLGLGTVIGGTLGAGYGLVNALTGSTKSSDQLQRDSMRSYLEQNGFATYEPNATGNMSHHVTLADGTKYDIGQDGGARYTSVAGNQYAPYQVDPDNQFGNQAVGWINPLAEVLSGGNEKVKTDLAGYLSNAAMSNANTIEGVRANVLSFMEQNGLDSDNITQALGQLRDSGQITPQEYDAYIYGVGTLMKGDPSLYQYGSVSQAEQARSQQATPVVNPQEGRPL